MTDAQYTMDIEKNGANTAFVAQQLAEAALKDRYAITRQCETADLTQLLHPEFKVLSQSCHVKKPQPGDQRATAEVTP